MVTSVSVMNEQSSEHAGGTHATCSNGCVGGKSTGRGRGSRAEDHVSKGIISSTRRALHADDAAPSRELHSSQCDEN